MQLLGLFIIIIPTGSLSLSARIRPAYEQSQRHFLTQCTKQCD